MDDGNVIDFDDASIAKLRNLKPYRDLSDEQIREKLRQRAIDRAPKQRSNKKTVEDYDKRFNSKLDNLTKEYALDMNNSNDVENLHLLVRLQIQNEDLSRDIAAIQRQDRLSVEDYRSLKTLGDFQTGTINAITNIQDKLGISRKIRKEKQVDDIPQFINGLLEKAKQEFDTKTTVISCPKCKIELFRFWLNFPHLENKMDISLTCWKCEEQILYAR
jgi:hypothetical protein